MSNTTDKWLDDLIKKYDDYSELWHTGISEDVFKQAILSHYKDLENNARIDELKRLKTISCFNKHYSDNPVCSEHIDIRIEELEQLQSKKEEL